MTVTLSPGTKKFEVTQGDSLVVSGQYSLEAEIPTCGRSESENQLVLKPDGIYKVRISIYFPLSHFSLSHFIFVFDYCAFWDNFGHSVKRGYATTYFFIICSMWVFQFNLLSMMTPRNLMRSISSCGKLASSYTYPQIVRL